MITQFNERWIVLGDITNSACFFHLLDKYTNNKTTGNKLLFEVTHIFNSAIEGIYQIVETKKPEKASLGNTMGDGFLVVGFAGHGNYHIAYESVDTLHMCLQVKQKADDELIRVKEQIRQKISDGIKIDVRLPDLKLKLCVHFGYVLTSVGFNRYIGDCINYCARIVSSAYEEKQTNFLVLTDDYFQLLPTGLKKCVASANLSARIDLRKYFDEDNDENISVVIWRIPFKYREFWKKVENYLTHYDPTKDMGRLKDKLYSQIDSKELEKQKLRGSHHES